MSIKEYNSSLVVMDATTGDVITVIKTRLFNMNTIVSMITNIFEDDYFSSKHGILIKHAIEP